MQLHNEYNHPFTLEKDIAGGSEARIWTVKDKPGLVAKIYHHPTLEHETKIMAMLDNPPHHPSIVWPTNLLYQDDKFAGFLMPQIEGSMPISNFYDPTKREKSYPAFNWQYLHRTALNLIIAAEVIHAQGHVIGNVNENSILVNSQAVVTFIDCDSFQIRTQTGEIHHAAVSKPESTPPELQGTQLDDIIKTPLHDNFGLAILIFQLLMEGYHPFVAESLQFSSAEQSCIHCIQEGIFPFVKPKFDAPADAPSFDMLHPDVQKAFIRCFVNGHEYPNQRPSPKMWREILDNAENALVTCSRDDSHVYSSHLTECPWCIRFHSRPKPLPSSDDGSPRPLPPLEKGHDSTSWTTSSHDTSQADKPSIFDRLASLQGFLLAAFVGAFMTICGIIILGIIVGDDNPTPTPSPTIIMPTTTPTPYVEGNAQSYYRQGNVYLEDEKYDQAIVAYTQAILLEPNYAEAYNNRAWAYVHKGDYDLALSDVTTAINFDKTQAYMYDTRGFVYYRKGYSKEALMDYTKAILLEPARADFYNGRARVHEEMDNVAKAMDDYKKVMRLNNNSEATRKAKENLERLMNEQD